MRLDSQIEAMKEEIISAVQACIQIKSVKDMSKPASGAPFGAGIKDALAWAMQLGEKLGFTVKNVDGYAGHIEMGSGELLGILGHLDVVPEGDGWSVPPYSGEIKDGRIYGRGALDDKGPSLAALFAMKAIKDANIPLSKRVRLILGTDEESGWADMDYYLAREEVPYMGFAPDAEFPLIHAEKGILHLELKKPGVSFPHLVSIRGGERPNIVPDVCEVRLKGLKREDLAQTLKSYDFPEGVSGSLEGQETDPEIKLLFKGVGAHGSLPQDGKNAVLYALRYLRSLALSAEEQKALDFVLNYPGTGFYGEGFGIAFQDEPSGKLSLNLGIFEFSAEQMRFVIDIRYPVTVNDADVLKPVEKAAQAESYSLEILSHQKSHHVPKDSELVKSLLKAYADVTGLEPYAFAIGGGTYAKALPQGVAFGPVLPGEPDVIHCADEYITVKNLILTTKVYAQAILNVAAEPEYR